MTSGIARETRLGQARIPLLTLSDMTPQQRAFHDDVVAGPRGQMIGSLLAAIHSPDLVVAVRRVSALQHMPSPIAEQTCYPDVRTALDQSGGVVGSA